MLIQIVLLAILAAILIMTWRRALQNVITRGEALLWSLLWIAAGFVVALPQTSTTVAHFFGVGRGADFIIYGSIVLIFFLLFRVFVLLEGLERKLTDIVRKDALRDLDRDV